MKMGKNKILYFILSLILSLSIIVKPIPVMAASVPIPADTALTIEEIIALLTAAVDGVIITTGTSVGLGDLFSNDVDSLYELYKEYPAEALEISAAYEKAGLEMADLCVDVYMNYGITVDDKYYAPPDCVSDDFRDAWNTWHSGGTFVPDGFIWNPNTGTYEKAPEGDIHILSPDEQQSIKDKYGIEVGCILSKEEYQSMLKQIYEKSQKNKFNNNGNNNGDNEGNNNSFNWKNIVLGGFALGGLSAIAYDTWAEITSTDEATFEETYPALAAIVERGEIGVDTKLTEEPDGTPIDIEYKGYYEPDAEGYITLNMYYETYYPGNARHDVVTSKGTKKIIYNSNYPYAVINGEYYNTGYFYDKYGDMSNLISYSMPYSIVNKGYLNGVLSTTPSYSSINRFPIGTLLDIPIFNSVDDARAFYMGDETVLPVNSTTRQEANLIGSKFTYGNINGISTALKPRISNSLSSLGNEKGVSLGEYKNIVDDTVSELDISNTADSVVESIDNSISSKLLPLAIPMVLPTVNLGTSIDDKTTNGEDWEYNYHPILGTISASILALSAFFVIDFDEIKAHITSTLTGIPEFGAFEPILGYFDYFRTAITDSYDYPVISITTPDILLPYYQQPEIILVDFADYAKYFVWARAILSLSILLGFGLWLTRDIKKFFAGL